MTTEITMEMIKELRAKTGVGISKCKEALEQSAGDLEEAVTFLRKAGIAQAVKKGDRVTNEGAIAVFAGNDRVAIVEVNSETDFVSQNERFQAFAKEMAEEVATSAPADPASFLSQPSSKSAGMTIDEVRGTLVQSLGENIQISRLAIFEKQSGHSVGYYVHMGGKMAAVVDLEGGEDLQDLGKELAMQAVAADPAYLSPSDVPEVVKEGERSIIREQIKNKPPEIRDKIVEGKLNAYYEQACLTRQKYVKDPSMTIENLLASRGGAKPTAFVRWQIGG